MRLFIQFVGRDGELSAKRSIQSFEAEVGEPENSRNTFGVMFKMEGSGVPTLDLGIGPMFEHGHIKGLVITVGD